MDPDFLSELLIQKEARADHDLIESEDDPKKREAKFKSYRTRRKVAIMKRREKQQNGNR